jgi:glucose/arabinose dehydrogenase
MKAATADNPTPAVSCGANQNWTNGNVILDRDRQGQDRKFGVSVAAGKIVFGVSGDGTGDRTMCGSRNVLDDVWHHVAVERRRSDGHLWIFVDGVLEAEGDGPDGDVSYPDDATPADPNDPFLVIGAEKFDTGSPFGGALDDIRISSVLRYEAAFTRPNTPFATDASTVALYHLDEAAGSVAVDSSGAAGGPSNGDLIFGGSPSGPEWSSTELAPLGGLRRSPLTLLTQAVNSPVHVTHAPDGSGRLFIVEKGGYIRIFKNGSLLGTPFLDIHTLVSGDSEQGLLSVAFHPDYAANGTFFVYYTDDIATPGDITLARYQVSANPDVADPELGADRPGRSPSRQLQPQRRPADVRPRRLPLHGDGRRGGGGDVPNNAQNKDILLGKILRLDVDGTGTVPCGQQVAMPYGIPASNPFVGAAGCDEIWAYGLRNPWRFSFDRANGDLLIGDVGQNAWEEVDYQLASSEGGENYGWHKMEGNHCYNPPNNCDDGSLVHPILEYDHGQSRCSISGGYRYRGTAIPGLVGFYLYADFCGGQIYAGKEDAAGTGRARFCSTPPSTYRPSARTTPERSTSPVSAGGVPDRSRSLPVPDAFEHFPALCHRGDPGFTLT